MVYGIAAVLAGVVVGMSPLPKTEVGSSHYDVTRYEACDGEVVSKMYQTCYIFGDRDRDDLANKKVVTEDDMNYLIDHYVKLHPDSILKGRGKAFIKASNETGLDPLFLLALAGIESGWGTSKIHIKKNNPYSIGMYGDGIHNGYDLGGDEDSFDAGIVAGANYIYEEYYKEGQKTLYAMNHHGDHSYCAGDSNWEYQIASEMDYLNTLLDAR